MIVPSGARAYATSSPQGIRLGAVIGEAPAAIALANEAETSRVRKAISTPAGCPSTASSEVGGPLGMKKPMALPNPSVHLTRRVSL
jgi:hypothetical protein